MSTYGNPNTRGKPLFGASKGGASRFFPQFKDEDEMLAWIERLVTGEPSVKNSSTDLTEQ